MGMFKKKIKERETTKSEEIVVKQLKIREEPELKQTKNMRVRQ